MVGYEASRQVSFNRTWNCILTHSAVINWHPWNIFKTQRENYCEYAGLYKTRPRSYWNHQHWQMWKKWSEWNHFYFEWNYSGPSGLNAISFTLGEMIFKISWTADSCRSGTVWYRSKMVPGCLINYQKCCESMFGKIITKKTVFTSNFSSFSFLHTFA